MTALLFWPALIAGVCTVVALLRDAARRTGLDETLATTAEDES